MPHYLRMVTAFHHPTQAIEIIATVGAVFWADYDTSNGE